MRLFRKIGNEWGLSATFSQLTADVSVLRRNALTIPVMNDYEQECRVQIRWDAARADLSAVTADWRGLLRIAECTGDDPTVVQGLWYFGSHPPHDDPHLGAVCCRAYLRHMSILRHPPASRAAVLHQLMAESNAYRNPSLTLSRWLANGPALKLRQAADLALR